MRKAHTVAAAFTLFGLTALAVPPAGRAAAAVTTAAELNGEARQSLDTLYKLDPTAAALAGKAKAILVFPMISKAGLIFGGSYGEGVLLRGDEARDYYNSVTGSYGVSTPLPAGAHSYGYAVFLMTDTALNYLNRSEGWEFGTGPTVVLIDGGAAQAAALNGDAYAFIYGPQGLMAGIALDGTKVSRIRKS